MWQYWLIASGVFFIGEIITVGFLLFWFGVAGLIAMIVSFFTSNIIVQMTVFIISSVILIFATKPFVKKFVNQKTIVTNALSIVGKKGIVLQEVDTMKGQVKIGGEIWSAQCEPNDDGINTNGINGVSIPVGSEVEVTKIEGVKVIVKPVSVAVTK